MTSIAFSKRLPILKSLGLISIFRSGTNTIAAIKTDETINVNIKVRLYVCFSFTLISRGIAITKIC
ncbi:MAG: hypothetical protein A2X61_13595 [Ignavibacteria bacterium GWB2_35_12]|nr:MAG: hypothetical protein A2X61_13595 [Ignavibacteria bacterium GWB2_35_12]OGU95207.1 MAG: hypothetical protein A2220_00315 [Ignavibacteria bacterium RIFOXYA2_FULL_35_10]OGV24501.1 MAG: hypothetical protein A2475_15460 [Ignavibacteria bacterium RIFOXYC2_FULL_35_21]